MHTIEEGIGPKDEPPSFDIKFLLAIIITVAILLLSVIIFISSKIALSDLSSLMKKI